MGVYGTNELAVLAAQFARGLGYFTITFGADRSGLDMPCDLNLLPHLRIQNARQQHLGRQIMVQTHGYPGQMRMIFCEQVCLSIKAILQKTCQYKNVHLAHIEEYSHHAWDCVSGKNVYYTLEVSRRLVQLMLDWVQCHKIISRVTSVSVEHGQELLALMGNKCFDGFLVLSFE